MTKTDPLASIERANLALAVVATVASGLIWGARGTVAAAVGAALACANFAVIRRLARRALQRVAAGGQPSKVLSVALGLKMIVLMALVWVAVGVLHLALLPFSIGISVLVLSLVSGGLRLALAEEV
jgi:hypothetical protein